MNEDNNENVERDNTETEIKEICEKCVKCGLCKSLCPVFGVMREETVSPRGKAMLLNEKVYDKVVYSCSFCHACEKKCPLGIKLCDAFKKARKIMVLDGKETAGNKEMIKNIREEGNPFGKEGVKEKKLYCC
jgi:fumarate reductase (CoM/CoB) subunit B